MSRLAILGVFLSIIGSAGALDIKAINEKPTANNPQFKNEEGHWTTHQHFNICTV